MLQGLDRGALLKYLAVALALAIAPVYAERSRLPQSRQPNVIVIITDDQGYGDLGAHGNPKLETPNLDRLAREAVQFQSFYVSPVCSPTRASLMTGRYNYRTGVVDTYLGRSLMHPDETTIAEMLARAGYRTGIFGKWHLGDNYPLRAMDQGFQESLVLNGGGIGQPSDPVGGESYFDPMLRHNGRWVQTLGYVSDVITDAAIAFIRKHQRQPFFTYLAFNAPHTPLQVPADKHAKYKRRNLQVGDFAGPGHPVNENFDSDVTAKIYGMVDNIDDNVGRVLAALDKLRLAERTIVIFMTDNGPQQPRYNAGLPGLKGTVHEGGIRAPLFVRWPGAFPPRTVDRIAAHIDLTPTLIEACGVSKPANVKFDGKSLLPLLRGEGANWPDRLLFFQWHRGDAPQLQRAFAARSQRYKLIQPQGNGQNNLPPQFGYQLYDMADDPLEQRNVAALQPEIVARMTDQYEAWFRDVTSGRDYADGGIARIRVGSPHENPVRLTRQDWRGAQAGWTATSLGHWEVDVGRTGVYEVTLRFAKVNKPGTISFALGERKLQKEVPAGATAATFHQVRLARGVGRLESWVTQDDRRIGMLDVVVKRVR
ncbi:MAG: arylsulfatase [Acidobacteriota bacterium]